MQHIINFKDDDLKVYGQEGFAYKYKIDYGDIVSITSGFYPELESNLELVDSILNITNEDKEKYLDKSLEEMKSYGHDINLEIFNVRDSLYLKRIIRERKLPNFTNNFIFRLVEAYDDYLSENYYDITKYHWNIEDIFWRIFRDCSSLRLEDCGDLLDSVNNIFIGKEKEKVDREKVFNLVKSYIDDKTLEDLEIINNEDSVVIRNVLVNKEESENGYEMKFLLKSGFIDKRDIKFIDEKEYDVYDVLLFKDKLKKVGV